MQTHRQTWTAAAQESIYDHRISDSLAANQALQDQMHSHTHDCMVLHSLCVQ